MAESEAEATDLHADSGALNQSHQSGQLAKAAPVNITSIYPAKLASKQQLSELSRGEISESSPTIGHASGSAPDRSAAALKDFASATSSTSAFQPHSFSVVFQESKPLALSSLNALSSDHVHVASTDTGAEGTFSVSGSAPNYQPSNSGSGTNTHSQSHLLEKAREYERERQRLQLQLQLLHPLQKSLYIPMNTSTSYTAPNTSRAPQQQPQGPPGQPEDSSRFTREPSNTRVRQSCYNTHSKLRPLFTSVHYCSLMALD